jgi:hypothetical protein
MLDLSVRQLDTITYILGTNFYDPYNNEGTALTSNPTVEETSFYYTSY